MCFRLLSQIALRSHLPGHSCRGPLIHEHWISMGPALWFQYKVPIVCPSHLSAVTNLASVVVGPGPRVQCVVGPCHLVSVSSSCRLSPRPPSRNWPGLSKGKPVGLKQQISQGPALQFQGQASTVCFLQLWAMTGPASAVVNSRSRHDVTPRAQFSVPNGMSVLRHSRLCVVTCPASPVVNAEAWFPDLPVPSPLLPMTSPFCLLPTPL